MRNLSLHGAEHSSSPRVYKVAHEEVIFHVEKKDETNPTIRDNALWNRADARGERCRDRC